MFLRAGWPARVPCNPAPTDGGIFAAVTEQSGRATCRGPDSPKGCPAIRPLRIGFLSIAIRKVSGSKDVPAGGACPAPTDQEPPAAIAGPGRRDVFPVFGRGSAEFRLKKFMGFPCFCGGFRVIIITVPVQRAGCPAGFGLPRGHSRCALPKPVCRTAPPTLRGQSRCALPKPVYRTDCPLRNGGRPVPGPEPTPPGKRAPVPRPPVKNFLFKHFNAFFGLAQNAELSRPAARRRAKNIDAKPLFAQEAGRPAGALPKPRHQHRAADSAALCDSAPA